MDSSVVSLWAATWNWAATNLNDSLTMAMIPIQIRVKAQVRQPREHRRKPLETPTNKSPKAMPVISHIVTISVPSKPLE